MTFKKRNGGWSQLTENHRICSCKVKHGHAKTRVKGEVCSSACNDWGTAHSLWVRALSAVRRTSPRAPSTTCLHALCNTGVTLNQRREHTASCVGLRFVSDFCFVAPYMCFPLQRILQICVLFCLLLEQPDACVFSVDHFHSSRVEVRPQPWLSSCTAQPWTRILRKRQVLRRHASLGKFLWFAGPATLGNHK